MQMSVNSSTRTGHTPGKGAHTGFGIPIEVAYQTHSIQHNRNLSDVVEDQQLYIVS